MTEAGYEIERGPGGLTAREREVMSGLAAGLMPSEIGKNMGVTKQRIHQLIASLERKGVLTKGDDGSITLVVPRA